MHQVIGVVIDQEVVQANRLGCCHVIEGENDAMEERKCLHYEVIKTGYQVQVFKECTSTTRENALVKEKDWSESDSEREKGCQGIFKIFVRKTGKRSNPMEGNTDDGRARPF